MVIRINTSLKVLIKVLRLKANFNPYKYQVYIANLKSFSNPSDFASKLSFSKSTSSAFVYIHKRSFCFNHIWSDIRVRKFHLKRLRGHSDTSTHSESTLILRHLEETRLALGDLRYSSIWTLRNLGTRVLEVLYLAE